MDEELKEQMKLVYEILADDELVDAIANMTWKLFTKLKEKGFTDDQAIKLVSNHSSVKK